MLRQKRSMFSAILHLNGLQIWGLLLHQQPIMMYVRYLLFFSLFHVLHFLPYAHCLLLSSSPYLALILLPIFSCISSHAVDRRRLSTRSYYLYFCPTQSLSWFSWDCKWNLQHKRICIYFPHFITLLQFSAIKILLQIQSLILQPTTTHILFLLRPLSIGIQIFIKWWSFLTYYFAASFFWFCWKLFPSFSTYDRTMENWMRASFDLKFNLWFTKERHKCTF